MIKRFTLLFMLLGACCLASAANYLTFTAEEDNSSFYPELKPYIEENTEFADNPPSIQYSLDDGGTWTEFQFPKDEPVVLAKKGDKVLLRGNNSHGLSPEFQHYVQFVMTGSIAASGNIQTLIDTTGESLKALPFEYLFKDCTSLTKAPDLPATVLTENCYYEMFSGCTNLTQAPKTLPATQARFGCYNKMFEGCTSLTKTPELFAFADSEFDNEESYTKMFSGCTSLSEIRVNFTEWPECYDWVDDVAPTGTFICPNGLPLEYGASRIPKGWTVNRPANYLTFTAETDSSTFSIFNELDVVSRQYIPDIQYSMDNGETWDTLPVRESILLAKKGDKALLRGDNPHGFSKDLSNYTYFQMTGSIAASGSVMSLIDNTGESVTLPDSSGFFNLFAGCSSLTQAPKLPATQLSRYCYRGMFERCSGLTKAPKLPATTLEEGCYMGMFAECTSLTQAPELPAATLAEYCYARMFSECSSLTQAPELPATELDKNCYRMMFDRCSSLTQAPELSATTLAEECYAGMFSNCTSLTQAPKLPATTLAEECYVGMFLGCASLTEAPELPATTLARNCYMQMFKECSNLSYIKVNFTQWPELLLECSTRLDDDTPCDTTYMGWVADVAPTGTFVCPEALPEEYGPQRIPQGWTVKAFGGVGTENFSSTGLAIWNEGRTLFVRGAEGLVEVYNLNGQLLRAAQGKDNETIRFIMPAEGMFVVKTETKSVKVIL